MEQKFRNKLFIAHQIIASLKMDDLTYTHLSHRINDEYFLLSPFGSSFSDVTHDDLIKLNYEGEICKENKHFITNPTGVLVHSGIYKKRNDINAIIHLHTNFSIAVSAMKFGLLPISQHALHFYEKVAYHKYDSLFLDENEQVKKMTYDLAEKKVMILNNHGFITCGKTIEEAIFYAYHLEKACAIQVMTLSSCEFKDIIIPNHDICKKACYDLLSFEENLGLRDWNCWIKKLSLNEI